MFNRLLIANRGEIACRVIRTARRMGLHAIAVYSEGDAWAHHVRLADEAWLLGPSAPSESYLSIERVIDAARRSGAEAVHPGYGFLSESAAFAEQCARADLIFVGPPANAMRDVGSKASAKALATSIGVPTVPGFAGESRNDADFITAADAIGYPVVVKATAGGGGRGMKVVVAPQDLRAALEAARREARLAFADDRLLLEKYLRRPRHVEVQIFADRLGKIVTFPERDCSLQRRHQKVVEETPAPGLPASLREALARDATAIAHAAGYVGAGTVEFLVQEGAHYFLEVNARLQVEHPVTEMVCGVDLVEWQLRVAAGEALPLEQGALKPRGCAMEARICAEDPSKDFCPSAGTLRHLRFPDSDVRIETAVERGDSISPFYDPLVAKLVVWSEDRATTLHKLEGALDEVELVGVDSNLDFLRALVRDDRFVSGQADTLVAETVPRSRSVTQGEDLVFVLAAGAAAWREAMSRTSAPDRSPWTIADSWRLYGDAVSTLGFHHERQVHDCRFGVIDFERFWLDCDSRRRVIAARSNGDEWILSVDGAVRRLRVIGGARRFVVIHAGKNHVLELLDPLTPPPGERISDKAFVAPLPARVARIFVQAGEHVAKGAPILVLEAMKMEIPMNAPDNGTIENISCNEGQSVREGERLVSMAYD